LRERDGTGGDATAGDGVFTFRASVPLATALGVKSMPVSLSDAQSRTGTTNLGLTVTAPPTNPSAVGAASPNALPAGAVSLDCFTVTGLKSPRVERTLTQTSPTTLGTSTWRLPFETSTVTVVVSSGPPPVTVPPLVGKPEADATTALEALGLKADPVDQTVTDVTKVGTVIAQDPASGTKLAAGSTVKLTIGRLTP